MAKVTGGRTGLLDQSGGTGVGVAERPVKPVHTTNGFRRRAVSPARSRPVPRIEPVRQIIDFYDLPASYNSTYVTLMARDPYWIYAYWEITPSSIDNVRAKAGADFERAVCVLRMYDVSLIDFDGSNAHRWFDLEVGYANNWYINLWGDNTSHTADIGMRMPDGRFFTLARSNTVTTPRASQSHRSEHIWMEVKDSPTNQPFVVGQVHGTANTGRANESSGRVYNNPKNSRRIYLNEDDIRAYYSKLSPLLRDVISMRLARNRRTTVSLKGSGSISEMLMRGMSKRQFLKRLLVGSSEELLSVEETEGASLFSGGASERLAGQRKFFFELNTELIVYGRTEPDAEVRHGDKLVALRPDGTFNMRFALPDGKIPLDFAATSGDKVETRRISTSVERAKTKYEAHGSHSSERNPAPGSEKPARRGTP